MSKVYEALRKGSPEGSAFILSALGSTAGARPAEEPRLPDVPAKEERAAETGRLAGHPARVLPIRITDAAPLLPFDGSDLHAAEEYRMIRTRLIQHPRQPRMMLVSSAGPGDGKSVTATNLAGAMALKTESNVLLVEGDLRRPALCSQLGMPSMPGLLNVLAGQAALDDVLIQVAQFPNLYVLPAGTSPSNPSELLDSSAWSSLRGTLREKFGYTIIDSPPVAAVADYDLLQVACDGVILVVRPDHTNRHDCRKAIESIPKDKLLGVVMNCVKQWFLVRSHGDYSSYYYYRRAQ